MFAVKPELPVRTMKEFVALAKADPDKFNVSTPPIGTTPQLQAEVLKLREGLQKMATVVFAGGGDALKALITGTVQLSSGVLAPAHPHIKAGTIKGLAVTGATRWHDLPDIPTMLEAGYQDFVFETYTALVAPAKTPPEIVGKLETGRARYPAQARDAGEGSAQSGFEVQAKDGKGTWRASPRRCRCSATSSPRPASRSCRRSGVRRDHVRDGVFRDIRRGRQAPQGCPGCLRWPRLPKGPRWPSSEVGHLRESWPP